MTVIIKIVAISTLSINVPFSAAMFAHPFRRSEDCGIAYWKLCVLEAPVWPYPLLGVTVRYSSSYNLLCMWYSHAEAQSKRLPYC